MLEMDSVWSRSEVVGNEISETLYNTIIGAVLLWGFGLNYVMLSIIPVEVVSSIPFWALMIGYMVCVFFGTYLFTSSDNPMVSFVGYNFVVVPIGIILIPIIGLSDPAVVQRALSATAGITLMFMSLGAAYPKFFLSIGRTLFFSLIAIVLVSLGMAMMGIESTIFDWLCVGIFSMYIGYDWARAQKIPKTVDNAVDSAAAIYLDIINLFLRLLRIFARR